MTSGVKIRGEPRSASARLTIETRKPARPTIPAELGDYAATIRTRRGQTMALACNGSEAAYVVRSGALTLNLTLPQGLRQIVAIFHPGDVVRSAFAPPNASAVLTVASGGEIWRLRWSAMESLAAGDANIARYVQDAVARQAARQAIHVTAVGQLDCRQRVATFLLELALRTGVPLAGGGVAFDLVLSRVDMADYLGLNADTLSRTMSRLRGSGVLSHPERHRALIRNLSALAALSPAAPSLLALYGEEQNKAPPCAAR